ncbi:AMP-dependent synthetase/ligase [Dillenia turbinata]|uniref:AMP-dependent synthetase/ligase n=1 Tax=Dillenia turbinata TaxID=194707 RepID=A0AAN8V704_9MAGN
MAEMSSIDPKNGYCPQTKIFHSIRPSVPLPPEDLSLSLTQYVFSLLCSTGISLDKANVLIDTTSDTTLSYSIFLNHVENLSNFLKSHLNLSKGDTAFILSPPCFQVPILYFSLLSLGVIVSPANPISAPSEISRQIYLSRPVIAFATKETSSKIPKNLKHGTMLIDSSEFHSILNTTNTSFDKNEVVVNVNQYDIAAIMYSSGTTGMVKGVKLTHRNFIALIAGFFFNRRFPDPNDPEQEVTLFTIPLFHVFGFFMLVRAVAMAEALVLMGRFEFGEMLKAVEKYRITAIPVSPPLVVALAKSDLVEKYDLSSLRILGCGGAPLGKEVSEKFQSRFPDVKVGQIFHSIRPSVPLPPESLSISITQYVLSLLSSSDISLDKRTVLIDAIADRSLSYSTFLNQIENLSNFLKSNLNLNKGDTAFILSPPCFQVPILYFSLLSLGVIVSPANPLSSSSEIHHQIHLCKPVIAFATKETESKIPKNLKHGTMLIDSLEFDNIINAKSGSDEVSTRKSMSVVNQHDIAAIMYSSGTTGRVKGVKLSHRNFIALTAGLFFNRIPRDANWPEQDISLFTIPLFHVFGFFMLVRAVAMAEGLVLMKRFDFEGMLKAVEKYRITYMPVSPPLVVAMAKSDVVEKYDLSSLRVLGSGGAPLGKEVSEKFKSRFPDVDILQGYGLTESCGGITKMVDPEEFRRYGSVGRLSELMEGMIVDPAKGEALPPGQQGELWLRGPMIMQGYVGDAKATAETLHPEGWLKTGDLCYFDSDGFLYIVDRLKELIKYKAYQVPPAELEHLLQSNPEIADAAVIGYPAEESGQIPMAYVVRKTGSSISEAQVMDFIAKQVAPYKKIRRVAFVSSIPKSPAGKILRRELVNHATSAASSKL